MGYVMKKLCRFHWDCGRQGDVTGLFVADAEEIENAIGMRVYFGEILGKHSEVYGELEEDDIEVISEDQEKIDWLIGLMDGWTISGYNPLHYLRVSCERCGYEVCDHGDWYEHEIIDGLYYCNDPEYLRDGDDKTCAQIVREETADA